MITSLSIFPDPYSLRNLPEVTAAGLGGSTPTFTVFATLPCHGREAVRTKRILGQSIRIVYYSPEKSSAQKPTRFRRSNLAPSISDDEHPAAKLSNPGRYSVSVTVFSFKIASWF